MIETLENCVKYVQSYQQKHQNDVIDVDQIHVLKMYNVDTKDTGNEDMVSELITWILYLWFYC